MYTVIQHDCYKLYKLNYWNADILYSKFIQGRWNNLPLHAIICVHTVFALANCDESLLLMRSRRLPILTRSHASMFN